MQLEHPDITATEATGYPEKEREAECFCDRCGRAIWPGNIYYDTGDEYWCRPCVKAMEERMD